MNHPNKQICTKVFEMLDKISEYHNEEPTAIPLMSFFIKPNGDLKCITQMNPEQLKEFAKALYNALIEIEKYKGGTLN